MTGNDRQAVACVLKLIVVHQHGVASGGTQAQALDARPVQVIGLPRHASQQTLHCRSLVEHSGDEERLPPHRCAYAGATRSARTVRRRACAAEPPKRVAEDQAFRSVAG
jgi:hypothetical protein